MLVTEGTITRMGSITSLAVLLSVLSVGIVLNVVAKEYSWTDFKEVIPPDALRGGSDRNGSPIYVGQIVQSTQQVPVKVYFDGKVDYNDCEDYGNSPKLKILCTQQPEQFEWISTNNNDIQRLTEKDFVILGYDEPETATYVGRVQLNGEIAVGKVDIQSKAAGLYVKKNGASEKYCSFEVLVFKSKSDIDVRFGSIP